MALSVFHQSLEQFVSVLIFSVSFSICSFFDLRISLVTIIEIISIFRFFVFIEESFSVSY